ncbi:MAG: hypothetical protein OXG15_11355 [Gammaproteobacteria bacterium]|nr:hypothetical protein [Gammaproteobacteria bacterium]
MSDTESDSPYITKLRRLWKGTLYIGIAALYIVVIVATLVLIGWQAGLLAVGLVALSQVFRYVASEVDRIGWVIRSQNDDEQEIGGTTKLRRRLFALLTLLVQFPNIALVVYVYTNIGLTWSVVLLIALMAVELLFQEIRRVNQKVAYREASYGFQDRSLLTTGQQGVGSQEGRDVTLTDRLDRLEKLVDEGKISRKGYEKARDKYWIRHVMESRE